MSLSAKILEAFGRNKFRTKCKLALKLTKARLEAKKKKRNAMQKYLKNDIAVLMKSDFDTNAYGKAIFPSSTIFFTPAMSVSFIDIFQQHQSKISALKVTKEAEGLYVELNLSSCYDYVDECCVCISENLKVMQKQRLSSKRLPGWPKILWRHTKSNCYIIRLQKDTLDSVKHPLEDMLGIATNLLFTNSKGFPESSATCFMFPSECPEECKVAVASLMHAAARFADLPELHMSLCTLLIRSEVSINARNSTRILYNLGFYITGMETPECSYDRRSQPSKFGCSNGKTERYRLHRSEDEEVEEKGKQDHEDKQNDIKACSSSTTVRSRREENGSNPLGSGVEVVNYKKPFPARVFPAPYIKPKFDRSSTGMGGQKAHTVPSQHEYFQSGKSKNIKNQTLDKVEEAWPRPRSVRSRFMRKPSGLTMQAVPKSVKMQRNFPVEHVNKMQDSSKGPCKKTPVKERTTENI
ncbi:hypothetical protein Ancab_011972 [Ancistrocladus abbreviatus]